MRMGYAWLRLQNVRVVVCAISRVSLCVNTLRVTVFVPLLCSILFYLARHVRVSRHITQEVKCF